MTIITTTTETRKRLVCPICSATLTPPVPHSCGARPVAPEYSVYRELAADFEAIGITEWAGVSADERDAAERLADEAWEQAEDEARAQWAAEASPFTGQPASMDWAPASGSEPF
jgi:hypothetical protein